MSIVRIIDEDGNRANRPLTFGHGWIDSVKISDIENDGLGSTKFKRFKVPAGSLSPHRSYYNMPG